MENMYQWLKSLSKVSHLPLLSSLIHVGLDLQLPFFLLNPVSLTKISGLQGSPASSIKALQNGGAVDLGVKSSLVSRLRLDPRESSEFVPLPGPLIRKYIAYARSYVFPRCVPYLFFLHKP